MYLRVHQALRVTPAIAQRETLGARCVYEKEARNCATFQLSARIGIATGEVVVGDFDGAGVNEEGAVIRANTSRVQT